MEDKLKTSKKGLTGSLAMRVLIISTLILALPLLLHSIIMYRQEYQANLKDLFSELNAIAENRVILIEKTRDYKESFLDVIDYHISSEPNITYPEISDYLRIMAKKFRVTKIFAIYYKNDRLICRASSTTCNLNADYTVLEPEFKKRKFSYVAYSKFLEQSLFYVGRTLYEADGKTPRGALIIANPAENLMTGLAKLGDSRYPLDLSLVSSHGLVLASSDKSLDFKRLTENVKSSEDVLLSPLKHLPNAYELIHDTKDFAVMADVPDIDLMLLLDVSENRIKDLQIHDYIIRISTLLFLIIIVGGGLTLLLTLRIAKPLKNLFPCNGPRKKRRSGSPFY